MPTTREQAVANILDRLDTPLARQQAATAKQPGRNSGEQARRIGVARENLHRYAKQIRAGEMNPEDVLFFLPEERGCCCGILQRDAHQALRQAYIAVLGVVHPQSRGRGRV
jgi:hypothetical protein